MAKKKPAPKGKPKTVANPPFCRGTVDEHGELSIQYRHEAGGVIGRQGHDENVGHWPDADIKDLIRRLTDFDTPGVEIELENMYVDDELADEDDD